MEKVNYTGFYGNCSEEQLECLNKLKDHLVNELKIKDEIYDDYYLLRFCRARKFKIDKVILMFDDFIKWREEYEVDSIPTVEFPSNDKVIDVFEHGYIGTDKTGRPIYIEKLGKVDTKKIFELFENNEKWMMKYFIQSYERLVHIILPICSKIKGEKVETTLTILDIKGLGIKKLTEAKTRHLLSMIIGITQNRYPETMGNLFIINAPMMFSAAWTIYKQFLDKNTIEKIKILGSSYLKTLLEYIDEEQLPEFLGGKFNKPLNENHGPWKENLELSIKNKSFKINN